jgi:hypothetical protein
MRSEYVRPDDITFLCVLSACSCMAPPGLAEALFGLMISIDHGLIVPGLEHLTCMVVAFGCTGRLDIALSTIHAFVLRSHHGAVWPALLSACKARGNAELARLAFDRALCLDRSRSGDADACMG